MVPGVVLEKCHFDRGGAVFNLFLENVAKRFHPWSRFGKWCHLRGWSRLFFLNLIIKGKYGSTLRAGTVFQNGSRAVLAPLFSQCGFTDAGSDIVLSDTAELDKLTVDVDSSIAWLRNHPNAVAAIQKAVIGMQKGVFSGELQGRL